MKKLYPILVICLALALTACSKDNPSDVSSDTGSVGSSPVSSDESSVSTSDISSDENKGQSFTKDFDGVVLTVTTDKSTYSVGEPINVTATLENNTDKAINLFYGASTTNGSAELMPRFEQLIEFPIYGSICRDDVVTVIPFAQGEKCIQDFTFQTYTDYFQGTSENGYITIPTEILPDYNKPAQPGVHSGKLRVQTCSDVNYPYGETDYTLDFSITIE